MITIKIWSDFACPFCYIGEKRLDDAIKELGWKDKCEIRYKAFELNPYSTNSVSGTTAERLAKKYNIPVGEAENRINDINSQARSVGIDMRFDSVKPSNTFDAHRLMKLAEAKYNDDVVNKLNTALFYAYFTENLDISDYKVLLKIGVESGLKEDDIKELLNGKEFTPEVRTNEQEASALGVRGVPYLVFNDKYAVPGAVSIDDFKRVLEKVFDEQSIEKIAEKAKACDENGCAL